MNLSPNNEYYFCIHSLFYWNWCPGGLKTLTLLMWATALFILVLCGCKKCSSFYYRLKNVLLVMLEQKLLLILCRSKRCSTFYAWVKNALRVGKKIALHIMRSKKCFKMFHHFKPEHKMLIVLVKSKKWSSYYGGSDKM